MVLQRGTGVPDWAAAAMGIIAISKTKTAIIVRKWLRCILTGS